MTNNFVIPDEDIVNEIEEETDGTGYVEQTDLSTEEGDHKQSIDDGLIPSGIDEDTE